MMMPSMVSIESPRRTSGRDQRLVVRCFGKRMQARAICATVMIQTRLVKLHAIDILGPKASMFGTVRPSQKGMWNWQAVRMRNWRETRE